VQSATSRVIFGELDNSLSPRIQALAAALDGPGMGGVATTDIRTDIWTKLLNNLTNGPICLLTRRDMRTTFTDPAILAAAKAVMHEGLAIAKALGHPVPGDPEAQILRSVTIAHKPSILQDLEAGRTLEFEALLSVPLRRLNATPPRLLRRRSVSASAHSLPSAATPRLPRRRRRRRAPRSSRRTRRRSPPSGSPLLRSRSSPPSCPHRRARRVRLRRPRRRSSSVLSAAASKRKRGENKKTKTKYKNHFFVLYFALF
jgi:hypothetical protein